MGHGHHHHHDHGSSGVKNIRTAFLLNLFFTLIEIVGGIYTNSVAIITDALHDLGDTISLGLAWRLHHVSTRKEDENYSFGYRRFSLLGAVINSLILVIGSVFILMETIPRLIDPERADAQGMIIIAVFGVLVNGAAVLKLRSGRTLNERVVMLHLLEDVLGWVAVLIGSVIMMFTDLPIIDPILACIILVWVLFNAYRNLMKGGRIFLQAIPAEVDLEEIKEDIARLAEVDRLEDVHLWSMDGEYMVITMHVIPKDVDSVEEITALQQRIRGILKDRDINHATIEVGAKSVEQKH